MKFLYSKSNTFIFIVLFVTAFAVRIFYLAYFKFDGLYGQDAYAYEEFSRLFFNSVVGFHIPPNFYWPIGFYTFSSLFSLLALGKTALGSLLVSLNSGALTAGLMYLLCFEVLGNYYNTERTKQYSFFAGLIICFAGITTRQSVVIMSDSLGLLFIIISSLYLVKYINEQNRMYIIFCFGAFAVGLITRYANGLFLAVILIVLFRVFRKSEKKKSVALDLIFAAITGFIIFLPQLLYILKYGILYFQFKGETPTWASSWNPVNIFRSEFFTVDGIQHYKFINGIYFLSPILHPLFLSLFGLPLITGFIKVFKKLRRIEYTFLLSWIAVYIIYLSGNPFQSIRYTLSFFPPLIIMALFGLAEINIKKYFKAVFAAAGILLLAGYSFYDFSKFAERKNKEKECVEWLLKNVRPGSHLYTFEITGAANYYTALNAKEFFNFNYSDIKQITDTSKGNIYLLLPVDKLNTQWKGLPVERSFDSLKTGLNPLMLGRVNDYEGFLITK